MDRLCSKTNVHSFSCAGVVMSVCDSSLWAGSVDYEEKHTLRLWRHCQGQLRSPNPFQTISSSDRLVQTVVRVWAGSYPTIPSTQSLDATPPLHYGRGECDEASEKTVKVWAFNMKYSKSTDWLHTSSIWSTPQTLGVFMVVVVGGGGGACGAELPWMPADLP